jgi:hypothetical protein
VATALTQTPNTDIHIATQKDALRHLTQSTIVHETLHNVTGKDDPDLFMLLTGSPMGEQLSQVINTVLEQHGCAGTQ